MPQNISQLYSATLIPSEPTIDLTLPLLCKHDPFPLDQIFPLQINDGLTLLGVKNPSALLFWLDKAH